MSVSRVLKVQEPALASISNVLLFHSSVMSNLQNATGFGAIQNQTYFHFTIQAERVLGRASGVRFSPLRRWKQLCELRNSR